MHQIPAFDSFAIVLGDVSVVAGGSVASGGNISAGKHLLGNVQHGNFPLGFSEPDLASEAMPDLFLKGQ